MLPLIAWRNIWRNKTRSLTVIISVVLGLWTGAFILAYAFGMIDQRLKDAIENEVSHLQIHHPEFDKDNEAKFFIRDGEGVLESMAKEPQVQFVTGRVITLGMVSSASNSSGGKLIGIQPDTENLVSKLKDKLVEGEYLDMHSRNKVIVGQKLANKLKVKLRSKIVLTCQDTAGNIVAGAFRVIGIYKTSNTSYDEMHVFVKDNDLADLMQITNKYHEIAGLVHDPTTLDSFIDLKSKSMPDLQLESWKTIAPELGLMIDSLDQYLTIFIGIILLALSFGIVNTMLMAVLERVREIGMLMAIGMTKARIFGMISLETIFLVALAAPIGLTAAYVTNTLLGFYGLDLSAIYAEGYAEFGFESIIYPKLESFYYFRILLMVALAACLAAIYPAITAIRLNPVKAIRKI